MEDKKTIYLHIGMPKTGTTTIQAFLSNNKNILEEKGILYPILEFKKKRFPGDNTANIREMYTFILREQNDYKGYVNYWKNRFLPIINASKANKILFSAEDVFISSYDLTFADVFLKSGFDFKVIVYVKKPTDYLTSLWGVIVKAFDTTCTLNDFISNFPVNYKLIRDLITKIGKENVIIRPFEKAQWKNNNLIDDFLDCIGLELTDEYKMVSDKNISYGRNKSELFAIINRLVGHDKDIRNELKKRLEGMTSEFDIKLPESIPDEKILEITNKYKPILTEIANIYGKESFFENDFPDCYGKERPAYDTVTFSPEEVEVLNEAIEISTKEKDLLREKCRILTNKNKIKFDYYKCRLLVNLTFGKRKQHYLEKKLRLRKELELIK